MIKGWVLCWFDKEQDRNRSTNSTPSPSVHAACNQSKRSLVCLTHVSYLLCLDGWRSPSPSKIGEERMVGEKVVELAGSDGLCIREYTRGRSNRWKIGWGMR